MQQHRSCLGVLLGIVLLVLLVFFGGRMYVHWHMAQVNHELFALAEHLGYTPDDLLQHRVRTRDFSMGFPFNTYCEADLYFTTPLDIETFAQKLNQAKPEMMAMGWKHYSGQLYTIIDITVSEPDAERVREDRKRGFITSYYWPTLNGDSGSVTLYETSKMSVSLEHKGHKVQGNVVNLYKLGGRFPIWLDCPIKTTEIRSSTD